MKRIAFSKKGVFSREDAFFVGRALFASAVLTALFYCGASQAACRAPSIDDHVSVQAVVDGDTIRLSNQKLVRLIGINTPEIHYDGTESEPLAQAAKEFLNTLLKNHQTVGLVYGDEIQDRHGRRLAHVFLDAEQNVQEMLLENGLAFWVAIPPNTRFLTCYQAAEAKAKQRKDGIWGETYFQPKNAAQPNTITPGFQRLQGTIIAAFEGKNSFWLKFNNTVALRIAQKNMHNFQMSELTALKGKTVTVRGWVYKHKNHLTMLVSHPDVIELQHGGGKP